MRRLLLLFPLLGITACVTPVIPLPPPNPESYSLAISATKDTIVLSGPADSVQRGVLLFTWNVRTDKGVIVRAADDGSFKTDPLEARDGDELNLWTARGADEVSSDIACAVVDFAGSRLQRCLPE